MNKEIKYDLDILFEKVIHAVHVYCDGLGKVSNVEYSRIKGVDRDWFDTVCRDSVAKICLEIQRIGVITRYIDNIVVLKIDCCPDLFEDSFISCFENRLITLLIKNWCVLHSIPIQVDYDQYSKDDLRSVTLMMTSHKTHRKYNF